MAKALYDFTTDQLGETSLRAGETIRLAPRHLQPRVSFTSFASGAVITFVLVLVIMVVGRSFCDCAFLLLYRSKDGSWLLVLQDKVKRHVPSLKSNIQREKRKHCFPSHLYF